MPSKNFHAILGIVNCYNFSGEHFASINVKSLESVSISESVGLSSDRGFFEGFWAGELQDRTWDLGRKRPNSGTHEKAGNVPL